MALYGFVITITYKCCLCYHVCNLYIHNQRTILDRDMQKMNSYWEGRESRKEHWPLYSYTHYLLVTNSIVSRIKYPSKLRKFKKKNHIKKSSPHIWEHKHTPAKYLRKVYHFCEILFKHSCKILKTQCAIQSVLIQTYRHLYSYILHSNEPYHWKALKSSSPGKLL